MEVVIQQKLHGNTQGLKASQSKALLSLYDRKVPANRFIHAQLGRSISELSRQLKRQIGLMISRDGDIIHGSGRVKHSNNSDYIDSSDVKSYTFSEWR